MSELRPVRGTHDLLGEDMRRHSHVHETARRLAQRYGYGEIETPIFEFTEVFQRTLGDTSDVVTKEMYTFTDRGGEQLTLRPENTAGVARAFVTNGLQQSLPVKLFYHGPMFRYERPQKGRMRQFHQIGIEVLGAPEALADAEVIALGAHVLDELGVLDKTVLQLNSLGDPESRAAYRDRLVAYFSSHEAKLSEDSRNRLHKNPLRILDSKDPGDRELVADAPLMGESLNQASKDFFRTVTDGLDALGIAYVLDPRLVRGLDYYTHTAFEFVTTHLGAQGTVLGGGRYDGLIRSMGGPDVPGVGWAAGVERLAALIDAPPPSVRPVAIVPIGQAAEKAAWQLATELRRAGQAVELAYKGKPGQRMKRADRLQARLALFLGDDELATGQVKLRDLASGEERNVARETLLDELNSLV
ncbi:MAG TPA: histidine--tRNA ligase [Geminicoccus sp.]|uniref:histidine--tRNA ligase n=1 Tax=Geminicoccus sp. TaxID=2024832 RepID=UPI002C6F6971|nr:histidine--tRNA ligase [Geminicoccus sp.]HWL69796.1 histidine--tRNA ligase [Geminicoccus sp.]